MDTQQVIGQLDALIARFDGISRDMPYKDFSGLTGDVYIEFSTLCTAAVDRIAGPNSTYSVEVERITSPSARDEGFKIPRLCGVIKALRDDLNNGYLQRFQDIAHAEVFADFLDMAEYLLDKGFKDASAVMIGGALESHLRQLCRKNGITLESTTPKGTSPKKADTMNADLAKNGVYSKLEQKNVVAWLDLRNKAAHAQYGEYDKDNVQLMLQGVTQFLATYPA